EIGPLNRYKAVFSIRPSTSVKLWCYVRSGRYFGTAETYLNVSDKTAPLLVTVHTEYAFVNLTRPGTLETINATEGDNINIACFALGFLYYNNSFNSSVVIIDAFVVVERTLLHVIQLILRAVLIKEISMYKFLNFYDMSLPETP
ncbi:hypothetical protein Anas_13246, partial [Armadillidium nasatum]